MNILVHFKLMGYKYVYMYEYIKLKVEGSCCTQYKSL